MQLFHRLKTISDLFESGKNEQARQLLREILTNYLALHDETERQRLHIESLEKIIEPEKNLFYTQGFFWLKTNGDQTSGPFCPTCMNTEGDLMLLEKKGPYYVCPYCNSSFPVLKNDLVPSREQRHPVRHARIINFNQ